VPLYKGLTTGKDLSESFLYSSATRKRAKNHRYVKERKEGAL
jgi:hypothetical protein